MVNSNIKNSTDSFRWVVISDVHAGCKRISTAKMLQSLRKYLPETEIAKLDLIVLAGDWYDDLLALNNDVVIEVDIYIAWLCRMCKKHDVSIRVLEGTPSHDWTQPRRFEYINNEISNIGADLVYIDELSIRYEEKFNMNFLFVPDEVHPDPKVTLAQVHELLQARNLEQVDMAFMHGQFEFQLPDIVKAPKHDSAEYIKIVRHAIFIGHIHTCSIQDIIYAQGSFDRTSHGQPEKKGYFKGLLKDDKISVDFVVNEDAHVFETIDCLGLTAEQTIEKVVAFATDCPEGSNIRIHSEASNPLFANMGELIVQIPHVRLTKKEESVRINKHQVRLDQKIGITNAVTITSSNVVSLLSKRFSNYQLDSKMNAAVTRQLNRIMGNGL